MASEEIGKLGIGAHERYAHDQKGLDNSLLQEIGKRPPSAQIDNLKPSHVSEVDTLLHSQRGTLTTSLFTEPEGYSNQNQRIFTFQVIPSLGTAEKREALIQKLQNVPPELQIPANHMINCLKQTLELDKLSNAVKNDMGRYHKG